MNQVDYEKLLDKFRDNSESDEKEITNLAYISKSKFLLFKWLRLLEFPIIFTLLVLQIVIFSYDRQYPYISLLHVVSMYLIFKILNYNS